MLLKDILARELKVWPEGYTELQQSFAGMVFQGAKDGIMPILRLTVADDFRSAIVTRAEWQAAVEALKAAELPQDSDWPDGAEFKGEGSDHFYRNVTSGSFEVWVRSRSRWEAIQGVPSYQPLIPRPTERSTDKAGAEAPVVEWKEGELPPVGTLCEVKHYELGWVPCEIVAHKVFDCGARTLAIAWIDANTLDQSVGLRFRKALTPEQKAAKEREEAIKEMVDSLTRYNSIHEACAMLYDAGYRKVSPSEGES